MDTKNIIKKNNSFIKKKKKIISHGLNCDNATQQDKNSKKT